MDEYPARESHYAHKLVRLMFRCGAVRDIGEHAALLVVLVAHAEDSSRYRGPVKFWNAEISEALGFTSPKQLANSRERAEKAGWLHYQRPHDRAVGEYWSLVPEGLSLSQMGKETPPEPVENLSQNGTGVGTGSGMGMGMGKGMGNGKPSIPIPCIPETLIPKPLVASPLSPDGDGKTAITAASFVERWNQWAASHGFAVVRKLTEYRRKKIKCRLGQAGWLADFREALRRMPLPGDGWQPDMDWFIHNEANVSKVLEGKYDWRGKSSTVQAGSSVTPIEELL